MKLFALNIYDNKVMKSAEAVTLKYKKPATR
jgi:hypothetical protein